jgi:autotransporter-associated beta strand protein
MVPANWAKDGQIAQWAAYLADENGNDYEGWFDAAGTTLAATGTNGGVLEGTIDLAGEFGGVIPSELYLAVGLYGNADGGTLLSTHQLPGTLDSDGNLQASEYLRLVLPRGWAIGGSGDWNTAWNWAESIPNSVGAHARLLNVIATPAAVNVDSAVTVGHITFSSPYGYTLAGTGSLALDFAAGESTITVTEGNHAINLPLTLNDNTAVNVVSGGALRVSDLQPSAVTLTKNGAGTLELAKPPRHTGLTINAGTLRVLHSDPTGANPQSGDNASVSRLSSLIIAPGATLDLTNNDLVLDYTGASPAAAIEALIASGYNVTGDWQGDGITSNIAALDGSYVLAVADNAALAAPFGTANGGPLFAGVDVDLTTVLVKFTHRADVDLDGVISPNDASIFGTNYSEGDPATWATGDMDYDGVFTPNDASIFGTFYDESVASLPEPAALGMIVLSGLFSAVRRPRRPPLSPVS